jgi:hypothetical protein
MIFRVIIAYRAWDWNVWLQMNLSNIVPHMKHLVVMKDMYCVVSAFQVV